MADTLRTRTLRPGARFWAGGLVYRGGSTARLTRSQEWYFRDQLVPTGADDPTGPPEDRMRAPASPQAAPAEPVVPESVPPPPPPPQNREGGSHAPAAADATDHPIHDLNVEAAAELVNSAGTLAALQALDDAEARHPKHQGGRNGVKRAIEARRAALTQGFSQ